MPRHTHHCRGRSPSPPQSATATPPLPPQQCRVALPLESHQCRVSLLLMHAAVPRALQGYCQLQCCQCRCQLLRQRQCQCRSGTMVDGPGWMAAAIAMEGCNKITMDGGNSDGQRRGNGWWDGGVIRMDNGMAAVQWTAQLASNDCRQHRSSTMGGNTRWTAVAITMDGGRLIAIDSNNGNRQQPCNGQWDG
jgi:hypothetical protein